jgi:hypothetical protein
MPSLVALQSDMPTYPDRQGSVDIFMNINEGGGQRVGLGNFKIMQNSHCSFSNYLGLLLTCLFLVHVKLFFPFYL